MAEDTSVIQKIRKELFGRSSSSLQTLDLELDRFSTSIDKTRKITNYSNLVDLVATYARTGTDDKKMSQQDVETLFLSDIDKTRAGVTSDRSQRYTNYEAILTRIPQCSQASRIYIDNILSPDNITKESLIFSDSKNQEDSRIISKYKIIKDCLDIEDHIDMIVNKTMVLGDYYVEIKDINEELKRGKIITEDVIKLTESVELDDEDDLVNTFGKEDEILEYTTKVIIDYDQPEDKTQKALNEDKKTVPSVKSVLKENDKKLEELNSSKLQNIQLEMHNPTRVVNLQTGNVCLGYLVFPDPENSKMVSTYANMMTSGRKKSSGDDLVDSIIDKILAIVPLQKIPPAKIKNDANLRSTIASLLPYSATSDQEIQVRFVAPEKMEHFKIESAKYHPYGESIFEPVVFTAKLVMMLKIAIIVYRLARAPEKRAIYVETGASRDVANIIEKVKNEIKKKEVTLDNFGTVDTIPKFVTMFEDYFIPQKDGKKFIEFDTQASGDLASKIEELEFLTKELISGLGVPPALLGYEQDVTSKALLSQENIRFARTIIRYQKMFSKHFTSLFAKIFRLVSKMDIDLVDNIKVVLPPPESLELEKTAELADTVARIITTLSDSCGIPKSLLIKKYLFFIDQKELEREMVKEKLENLAVPTEPQEQEQA